MSESGKRGRGKPAKYGERKSRTLRLPDKHWAIIQAIAVDVFGLDGAAELLIQIAEGNLAVVKAPSSQSNIRNPVDSD